MPPSCVRVAPQHKSTPKTKSPATRNSVDSSTPPITTYKSRARIASSKNGPSPGQLITTSTSSDPLSSVPILKPNSAIHGGGVCGNAYRYSNRRREIPCTSAARKNGASSASATAARTCRSEIGNADATSAVTGSTMCEATSRSLCAAENPSNPTGGMVAGGFERFSAAHKLRDVASHVGLPVTALVASALPISLPHLRPAVAEAPAPPLLRAAEGHGISRRRLLYRYALPAAAHPLIALFGVSIGTLLSGSLLVEVVMSWPGLGPFLLEAILARDLYVVIGGVLLSTLFLVAGNFVGGFVVCLA